MGRTNFFLFSPLLSSHLWQAYREKKVIFVLKILLSVVFFQLKWRTRNLTILRSVNNFVKVWLGFSNFRGLANPEEAKEGIILTFLLSLQAFNGLSCLYLLCFEFVLFSEWLFMILGKIHLPILLLMYRTTRTMIPCHLSNFLKAVDSRATDHSLDLNPNKEQQHQPLLLQNCI